MRRGARIPWMEHAFHANDFLIDSNISFHLKRDKLFWTQNIIELIEDSIETMVDNLDLKELNPLGVRKT